jgi:hypothetical protein
MEENKAKVMLECIDSLFKICGYDKTHADILDDPNWRSKYFMNLDQYYEWWADCVRRFVQDLKMSLSDAEQEASTFIVKYGFTLKSHD